MKAFAFSEPVHLHHGPQVHGHFVPKEAPSRPHPPPLSQMPWERVAQAAAEDREFAYQRLNISEHSLADAQGLLAGFKLCSGTINSLLCLDDTFFRGLNTTAILRFQRLELLTLVLIELIEIWGLTQLNQTEG